MSATAVANPLDEFFLHMDTPAEPWGIQLELAVTGSLDGERLAAALRAALRRHPMARVRLAPRRDWAVRYRWQIAAELPEPPLIAVTCRESADLDRVRAELFRRSPDLGSFGPFELVLAHVPGGDRLLLNLHHAAGDAASGVRLLRSVLEAYAGTAGAASADSPESRDVRALLAARSLTESLRRAGELARIGRAGLTAPVPIAPAAPAGGSGYGFRLFRLADDLRFGRAAGVTVNDILLGALAVTVRRWNDGRGAAPGRVSLTMPVNGRPEGRRYDVVGNFSIGTSVSIPAADTVEPARAIAVAAARTGQIKRHRTNGLMVTLLAGLSLLPIGLKRRLFRTAPLAAARVLDTAILTNLGVLPALPAPGGAAGTVAGLWFSSPLRLPTGISLGVVTLGAEMFACLCYQRARFDAAGAAEFSELFQRTLRECGGPDSRGSARIPAPREMRRA
ncbi:hypothetical protein [Nocardia harenae]|uniref:hypothetical protein n=1 Tax=Nocardia harenae TaxID=358707 RepID=UPI0008303667|nr:hypothetical protein [Nocardia harenae]